MGNLRRVPVVLSALLLGAHFLRGGHWLLLLASLAIPAISWIRRPWAPRIVQVALIAGALEWARTLALLVMAREAIGAPWTRLALILGTVAVFTACSALVFGSGAQGEHNHG